ncbi:MAG: energy transducer TonB [Brevinematia bacterium]
MLRYILISALLHLVLTIGIVGTFLHLHQKPQEKIRIYAKYEDIKVVFESLPKKRTKNTDLRYVKSSPQKDKINLSDTPTPSELPLTNTEKNQNQPQSQQTSTDIHPKTHGLIIPPKVLFTPHITYPFSARLKKIEGSVTIGILISTNGKVKDCWVIKSSGSNALDSSAIEYVKGVIFEPARNEQNVPVEFETTYIVHFILK